MIYSIIIRLGYSRKGWTDREIGAEWIKYFKTKEKTDGK
jgi:hypothetical protein